MVREAMTTPKRQKKILDFKPLALDWDLSSDCANLHEANILNTIKNSPKVRQSGGRAHNHSRPRELVRLDAIENSSIVKQSRARARSHPQPRKFKGLDGIENFFIFRQSGGRAQDHPRPPEIMEINENENSCIVERTDSGARGRPRQPEIMEINENENSCIVERTDSGAQDHPRPPEIIEVSENENSSVVERTDSGAQRHPRPPEIIEVNENDNSSIVERTDSGAQDHPRPPEIMEIDGIDNSSTVKKSDSVAQDHRRPPKFIEIDELPFSIDDLNRWPRCPLRLELLKPSMKTLLMFKTPLGEGTVPVPTPKIFKNTQRDQVGEVVLLPCDQSNIIDTRDGEKICKWDLIVNQLKNIRMESVDHLERVIKDLNPTYSEFNFNALRDVLDSVSEKMTIEFLQNLLPNIIKLSLSLKEIVTQPVPLLRQGESKTLMLSQQQVACLMAHAFLCLFPKRNSNLFRNYPDINFWRLLSGSSSCKVEKLKCIINYFKRVIDTHPTGVISFTRMSLKQENSVQWSDSRKPLPRLAVSLDGRIEKEGRGMLQVDFANQMIGGGILAHGCVQEEIMFAICPEMIISRLFCERLLDYEVIFITGAEQYNTYDGYGNNFRWSGNFVDETPVDCWSRRMHHVVAMDAKMFTKASYYNQFKPTYVDRELNKAFCGFSESMFTDQDAKVAVSTGNWGCGAFGGDRQLKFLIQLLAASQAERDILYFTFGDKTLKKDIVNIYSFLIEKRATVSVLYNIITSYFEYVQEALELKSPKTDLFGYIKLSYEKEEVQTVSRTFLEKSFK